MTGASTRPRSIREYFDACPNKFGHGQIKAACEKHGISLDSPWPPQFPKSAGAAAGKAVAEALLPPWPEATPGARRTVF